MMGHAIWICLFFFVALEDPVKATSSCDPDRIDKIRAFWTSHGIGGKPPSDVLATFKRIGPENIYWTTNYYSPKQDETSCLYIISADNGLGLVAQFHNSSLGGGFFPEHEEPEYLLNPVTDDKVYIIILNDCGVTAWYRCNDNGEVGEPYGAIKVARGFSPEAVTKAVEVLGELGIKIVHQYSLNCNPCYPNCKNE